MAEAYCGPSPAPQALLFAWNADAAAFFLCVVLSGFHFSMGDRERRVPFASALTILLVLFVSPLCALTVALFSARVAHHLLLTGLAAPLLALAFPFRDGVSGRVPLAWLVAVHAAILWFWHAPPVYEAAVYGAPTYWAMQISLLASAFFLWRRVLCPQVETGSALLALLATIVQMGMLGALLTFSREPLYAPHLATTLPYGLTPLADQQLAGLIMWVPAALPWLAAALLLLAARFDRIARNTR